MESGGLDRTCRTPKRRPTEARKAPSRRISFGPFMKTGQFRFWRDWPVFGLWALAIGERCQHSKFFRWDRAVLESRRGPPCHTFTGKYSIFSGDLRSLAGWGMPSGFHPIRSYRRGNEIVQLQRDDGCSTTLCQP